MKCEKIVALNHKMKYLLIYTTDEGEEIINNKLMAKLINLYESSMTTSSKIGVFYRHLDDYLTNYLL